MTTVALARRATTTSSSRHTSPPPEPGGNNNTWAAGFTTATTNSNNSEKSDAYPFNQRVSMRSPDSSVKVSNGNGGSSSNSDSWWQMSRRRSSSIDIPQSTPAVFIGGTVMPDGGGGASDLEYNNITTTTTTLRGATNKSIPPQQQPLPFDEDRLEMFTKRTGSFGPEQTSDCGWRGGGGQGGPAMSAAAAATSGLEVWSYRGMADPGGAGAAAAGMPWTRGEGYQDLRVDGGQVRNEQRESVNGPSQRLHEMKAYFRRIDQRAPTDGHETSHHRGHPYFEGAVFRSRSGGGGGGRGGGDGGGDGGGLIHEHHDSRRDESNGQNIGAGGGGDGGGGGVVAGAAGRQGGDRMPWHEAERAAAAAAAGNTGAPASEPNAGDPTVVAAAAATATGIINDEGGNGCRVWEVGTNAGAGSGGGGGGGSTGAGGHTDDGVEFDPQADCKPVGMLPAGQQQVAPTGSPTSSWWRDVPEPAVATFPWDLQLPNPAPPLAPPHGGPSAAVGRGNPADASNLAGAGGLGVSSSSAAVLRGGGSGGNAPGHSPLCRCDACRFAKATHPSRHRIIDQQCNTALDMMDGSGRGGGRSTSGAVLMDAAAARVSGSYGVGLRWGVNPPPEADSCASSWGLAGGGVGGNGGGYLATRKVEDVRRGGAPICDTLIPPGPHAPAYNTAAVSVVPRGMLQHTLGGPERLTPPDLFQSPPGNVEGNSMGRPGPFDSRKSHAKRSRVSKVEDVNGCAGGLSESGSGQRSVKREAGAGRGGAGASKSSDGRAQKASGSGKKTPASSRRCRAEGCQSHPNFGMEGDRRALYCAKHKLHGMINVKAPRCQDPGCTRNPVYGHAGDPRATFCLSHKTPVMVDVKNRCCEYPGCRHQPSFGMAGDRRANFCFAHKLPSHVNIRRARARAS